MASQSIYQLVRPRRSYDDLAVSPFMLRGDCTTNALPYHNRIVSVRPEAYFGFIVGDLLSVTTLKGGRSVKKFKVYRIVIDKEHM